MAEMHCVITKIVVGYLGWDEAFRNVSASFERQLATIATLQNGIDKRNYANIENMVEANWISEQASVFVLVEVQHACYEFSSYFLLIDSLTHCM